MNRGQFRNKPFEEMYVPVPESGCWLATTWWDADGYGRTTNCTFLHRRSYEIHFGSIPNGMFVCHKCDTPACVNPDHLFLGDGTDNMRDMVAKGRHYETKKTHCPQGHPYSGRNVRRNNRNQRLCVTCVNARQRATYDLKKSQLGVSP